MIVNQDLDYLRKKIEQLFNFQLMEAIEFGTNYNLYLEEIKSVIKPRLTPIIEELKSIDSHDLVSPETWLQSENDARGFVLGMFIERVKEYS